jgi:TonB family protein
VLTLEDSIEMEETRKPSEEDRRLPIKIERAARILSKPITPSWRGRGYTGLDIGDIVIPIVILILLAYGRRYIPGLESFNAWLDRYAGYNQTSLPLPPAPAAYEPSPAPTSAARAYRKEEPTAQTEDRKRAARTEVTVSVEVSETGEPLNASVIRSVNTALDRQAIGDAMKRHYSPVMRHGRPVRSLIEVTVPVQK